MAKSGSGGPGSTACTCEERRDAVRGFGVCGSLDVGMGMYDDLCTGIGAGTVGGRGGVTCKVEGRSHHSPSAETSIGVGVSEGKGGMLMGNPAFPLVDMVE